MVNTNKSDGIYESYGFILLYFIFNPETSRRTRQLVIWALNLCQVLEYDIKEASRIRVEGKD